MASQIETTMLTLENLSLQLGSNHYNFNLVAGPDHVSAILGKSGSGKSTLLNLIAGFLPAKSGTLRWQQQSLLNTPANQRPVTTLFQQHNLFTHLNVQQNIGLGISPELKLTLPDHEKINKVLAEVGLDGYAKNNASTLSGGEQQRVALARCLVRAQPILLLDEPFSALDESTRHEMIELTNKVIKQHRLCVILVTHNKDDASMLNALEYELTNGELQASVNNDKLLSNSNG